MSLALTWLACRPASHLSPPDLISLFFLTATDLINDCVRHCGLAAAVLELNSDRLLDLSRKKHPHVRFEILLSHCGVCCLPHTRFGNVFSCHANWENTSHRQMCSQDHVVVHCVNYSYPLFWHSIWRELTSVIVPYWTELVRFFQMAATLFSLDTEKAEALLSLFFPPKNGNFWWQHCYIKRYIHIVLKVLNLKRKTLAGKEVRGHLA